MNQKPNGSERPESALSDEHKSRSKSFEISSSSESSESFDQSDYLSDVPDTKKPKQRTKIFTRSFTPIRSTFRNVVTTNELTLDSEE